MKAASANNDGLAHILAAATGLVVTLTITVTNDVPIAWASTTYFVLGIPVMCMVTYLLSRTYPVRVWRWPLSMMLGQVFSAILYGQGALVPVAMAYVTLLSIPQFLAGMLGARSALKKQGAQ